jgi:ABC-type sugar transport system ATPase subunit
VRAAAALLHLDALLDRRPTQLSGGQRQRVAIGRAIVREPTVFLFDEPLSNLDAELRVQMRTEITALHQRLKTTMIYVTHDQVEAMTMADKIVVLRGGRVEQIGAPLALYNLPRNRFVAGFIGSPRMNFLSVQVAGVGPGRCAHRERRECDECRGTASRALRRCCCRAARNARHSPGAHPLATREYR